MKWIVLIPLLAGLSSPNCNAQDVAGLWGPLRHLHSECSLDNLLACFTEQAEHHDD